MKYDDLMIDTETMGLPPDGALLSIGAVFFDLQSCTLGPTFNCTINLATAVRDGGTLNPGTVMWWLGQSDQARNAVRFSGVDIRTALADLSAFIAEHSDVRSVRPWGNGSAFDLTVIGSAYQRAEMDTPWYFANERCFRTVRNMYPSVEYNPDEKGDVAHNALGDAIFQARHLFKIKNRNKVAVFQYARFAENGYEVSSQGDARFSALTAKLEDGRTIEMHYQCDVKGYQPGGTDWRIGKGKPPLRQVDTWAEYLALWRRWATLNPTLIAELRRVAAGKVLTDQFATSPVSQARALAEILNGNA